MTRVPIRNAYKHAYKIFCKHGYTHLQRRKSYMENVTLEAIARAKKPGKFKEAGFVPGILYGDAVAEATSVKFDVLALNKVINTNGKNAKVWVHLNENKQFGYIKEVQRHPMTRDILHIDVQIVSVDHEIKKMIPITFKGEEALKHRLLSLLTYKAEVTVFGKMALMPDTIIIDVAEMALGEDIVLANLNLDVNLKVDKEDIVYATINHLKTLGGVAEPVAAVAAK